MTKSRKPTIDPLHIFMHGVRFMVADERLRTTNDQYVMTYVMAPALVLSAFASETFLKCLIALETGHAPDGHNLKNLFQILPRPTQRRIEELWDEYVQSQATFWDTIDKLAPHPSPRDLLTSLSEGNKGFVELRYSYEGETARRLRFRLGDLPRMLRRVILELRPEWQGLAPTLREITSPTTQS
jgi:hypothetical protein